MLKALGHGKRGPILITGLSEENILRLKNDRPIILDLNEYGLPDIGAELFLFYGRTEAEMLATLKRGGFELPAITDPQLAAHLDLATNESKVLIATVGLPQSGKSTWARTQSYPIVCPDEIRTALHGQRFAAEAEPFVWAIAKVMVRSLFGAGHQFVILDACNTTRKRRDEWLSPEWALRFKYVDTPATECYARAESIGEAELLDPVISRMAAQFEPLSEDEKVFQ